MTIPAIYDRQGRLLHECEKGWDESLKSHTQEIILYRSDDYRGPNRYELCVRYRFEGKNEHWQTRAICYWPADMVGKVCYTPLTE